MNGESIAGSSSRPSDQFRLRCGPRRWRELSDLGDPGCWQAREQILQVIERVDPVPTATAQQRVDHRAPFASLRMSHEQPVFLSKSRGAYGILHKVVVDLDTTVSNTEKLVCSCFHDWDIPQTWR